MIIGFISLGCFLLGVSAILFMLARKSRSLSNDDVARLVQEVSWYRRLEAWWGQRAREALESGTLEQRFSLFAEKFLRGIHVMLLRADNRLHETVQFLRERRAERAVDQEYWSTVQNVALGKKIGRLLHDIRKNYHRDAFDPIEEERLLTEGQVNSPERWFNLIRFYLAKDHTQEAQRIIVRYWLQSKCDANIFILLEGVLNRAGGKRAAPAELSSQDPRKEL